MRFWHGRVGGSLFPAVRKRINDVSLEAIIGVSYAIAFAAVLFIPGVAGAGHAEVKEMLFGDLFALASWPDLIPCLWALAPVALCAFLFRTPLWRLTEQYAAGGGKGKEAFCWDVLFYALMGMAITISVRVVGVIMVFVYLIVPATLAALLASRHSLQLGIIACTVVVASAAGLGASTLEAMEHFSMGPPIGVCLGLMLVGSDLIKKGAEYVRRE